MAYKYLPLAEYLETTPEADRLKNAVSIVIGNDGEIMCFVDMQPICPYLRKQMNATKLSALTTGNCSKPSAPEL